jgi:hypothetical protein
MTVNIEGSASSIPESLDSLKTTPLVMHRVWFDLKTEQQWYAVMAEARMMFGRNWRGQGRVKRKFSRMWLSNRTYVALHPIRVWFDVPNPAFATWVAIKHGVDLYKSSGK